MEIEEIKKLMTYLEESKLRKMVIKQGDFELHLEKEGAPGFAPRRAPIEELTHEPAFQSEIPLKGERGGVRVPVEPSGNFVSSPMVGTYYSSPSPDKPPFVKVGDQVTASTVVCIIEAMKVLNEVKAGIAGTVAEMLVDNAQPVEFGTRLLRIV